MLVIAHAGHWAVQLLYLAPLLAFVVILVRTKLHERREAREGAAAPEDAGPPPDA